MRAFEPRLTIGFPRYGNGRKSATIEIRDTSSRTVICRLELSPEQLLEALAGVAEVECEGEFTSYPNRVGLIHESRKVVVEDPRICSSTPLDEILADHLNDLNVDGWTTDIPKRSSLAQGQIDWSKKTIKVTQRRYVAPDPPQKNDKDTKPAPVVEPAIITVEP